MAITTLAEVKTFLGLTDNSKDALITMYIPLIEQHYLELRNVPWALDDLDAIVYPIGSNVTACEMIGFKLSVKSYSGKEVSSESLDAHSISFVGESARSGGYPKSITSAIKRYINGA